MELRRNGVGWCASTAGAEMDTGWRVMTPSTLQPRFPGGGPRYPRSPASSYYGPLPPSGTRRYGPRFSRSRPLQSGSCRDGTASRPAGGTHARTVQGSDPYRGHFRLASPFGAMPDHVPDYIRQPRLLLLQGPKSPDDTRSLENPRGLGMIRAMEAAPNAVALGSIPIGAVGTDRHIRE